MISIKLQTNGLGIKVDQAKSYGGFATVKMTIGHAVVLVEFDTEAEMIEFCELHNFEHEKN